MSWPMNVTFTCLPPSLTHFDFENVIQVDMFILTLTLFIHYPKDIYPSIPLLNELEIKYKRSDRIHTVSQQLPHIHNPIVHNLDCVCVRVMSISKFLKRYAYCKFQTIIGSTFKWKASWTFKFLIDRLDKRIFKSNHYLFL